MKWLCPLSLAFIYYLTSEGFSQSASVFKLFLKDYLKTKYLKKLTIIKGKKYNTENEWIKFSNKLHVQILKDSTVYIRSHPNHNYLKRNGTELSTRIRSEMNSKSADDNLILASLFTNDDLINLEEIFVINSNQRLFWLILVNSERSENLIKKLPLRADNLATFALNDQTNSLLIFDYYKTVPNGDLHKTFIASWNPIPKQDQSNSIYNLRNFNPWRKRTNLSEVLVKCVLVKDPYYVAKHMLPNGTFILNGPFADTLYYLQKLLNFKFEIITAEDDYYGSYDKETNTWSGYMNDLIQLRADLVVGDMDITALRASVVDYLTQIDKVPMLLVYYNERKKLYWSHYINEFSFGVWIVIAITFLIFILCLKIISCVSPMEKSCSLSDAFIFITSVFCSIGCEFCLRSISGRIFLKTAVLSSFILFSFYTSLLFMFLTLDKRQPLFTDLEGLYHYKDTLKIVTMRKTSSNDYFKYSKISTVQNIWKEMKYTEDSNLPTSDAELLDILMEENTVGVISKSALELWPPVKYTLSIPLFDENFAWAVSKDYSLKHIISYYIQLYLESGSYKRAKTCHVEHLKMNLTSVAPNFTSVAPKPTSVAPKPPSVALKPPPVAPKSPSVAPKPLSVAPKPPSVAPKPHSISFEIKNFFFLFFILGFGVIFSVFTLFAELYEGN